VFTRVADALPLKKRALRGRCLVLVDIENVAGGAVMTEAIAGWARDVVVASLALAGCDQIVVGTSHAGLFNVWAVWPRVRLRVRSGANGADLALLDVMQFERIEQRFDEVVLVSGDGIFADLTAHLAAAGVRVTVASWAESLSTRLRLAASHTIYLQDALPAAGEGIA
jgi:NYN domain